MPALRMRVVLRGCWCVAQMERLYVCDKESHTMAGPGIPVDTRSMNIYVCVEKVTGRCRASTAAVDVPVSKVLDPSVLRCSCSKAKHYRTVVVLEAECKCVG